jgi:hypothetical protein
MDNVRDGSVGQTNLAEEGSDYRVAGATWLQCIGIVDAMEANARI